MASLSTNGSWRPYPYLAVLDAALVDLAFSAEPVNLIVTMPPRHGKSTLVSRYFPAWYTGHFPDRRVLLASYEGNFASSWGLKAMDEANTFGDYLFGLKVRRDVCAASNWQYRGHDGGMSCAGVGGPMTGRGGHVLIIDDPIKNGQEARSKLRRDEVWDWFQSTALTRLEPGGSVVIIQTRWNEDDLAGRAKREMKHLRWREIDFPAIAEEGDYLGRPVGAPLCPARFDLPALLSIKEAIGSYWFSALYQQRPRPEEGNIFKDGWFGRYRPSQGVPGHLIRRTAIVDTAHKEKKQNDYSTFTVLDLTTFGIYLRFVWRDRAIYPVLKRKVVELGKEWAVDEVVVEDADAGAMLIQELATTPGVPPIIPIKADRDKVARAHAASPMCEAGKVFIPHEDEAPWMEAWLSEMLAFPNADNDDQVDGFVHGINRLKEFGFTLGGYDSCVVDTGYRSAVHGIDGPR